MRDGYPGWDGESATKGVIVGTVPTQLCEANARRIALIIGTPPANTLMIGRGPDVDLSTTGIRVPGASAPIVLSRALHGGMCTQSWWGIHSIGAAIVGVAEAFE